MPILKAWQVVSSLCSSSCWRSGHAGIARLGAMLQMHAFASLHPSGDIAAESSHSLSLGCSHTGNDEAIQELAERFLEPFFSGKGAHRIQPAVAQETWSWEGSGLQESTKVTQ